MGSYWDLKARLCLSFAPPAKEAGRLRFSLPIVQFLSAYHNGDQ